MKISIVDKYSLRSESIHFPNDPDIRPDIRFSNFLNTKQTCIKFDTHVYYVILKNL